MALDPWSYAASTKSEHAEQVALFMWCNMAGNFGLEAANDPKSYTEKGYALARWPFRGPNAVKALQLLFAIHNQGHGDAKRGMDAKAEGVKAGVPDMMLPVARITTAKFNEDFPPFLGGYIHHDPHYNRPHGQNVHAYHGLYIELKRLSSVGKAAGKTSEAQDKWRDDLLVNGYAWELAYGWEAAKDILLRYLGVTVPTT